MKNLKFILILLVISINLFFLNSCANGDGAAENINVKASVPEILNGGDLIKIKPGTTDQIVSVEASKNNVNSDLKAPCKIVVAAVSSMQSGYPSLVFENTELSDLYSEYIKTKTTAERGARQVERLKALTSHQAVAAKELQDAETDLSLARTSLAAIESKFRILGIDMSRLLKLSVGKTLVIADIPESQMGYIKQGDRVNIVFNSYPNESFKSSVIELGKAVDPQTRSLKALIELSNDKQKLVPGLYGQTLLLVNENAQVTAPINALITAKGKNYVFVEKNKGEYERREAMIGVQGPDFIEILQGVNNGEKVVVKGAMLLKSLSFGY